MYMDHSILKWVFECITVYFVSGFFSRIPQNSVYSLENDATYIILNAFLVFVWFSHEYLKTPIWSISSSKCLVCVYLCSSPSTFELLCILIKGRGNVIYEKRLKFCQKAISANIVKMILFRSSILKLDET